MMKLGLFLQGGGHHIAAWRDPNVEPNASQSMAHYINISRIAERAKFDMVFTADTQATFGADDIDVWRHTTGALRLEPLSLFGAIAATTDRIGLVSTATTTYYEPYHIARIFASLDQMSGGRCGWNLVGGARRSLQLQSGRPRRPRGPVRTRGGIRRRRAGLVGQLGGRRHHRKQGNRRTLRSR
jgi:alkanesulfonate monooxygenase SsuD/methylene tetrahydromethanopterin reductase-like flavin-dependent oxidoreductase (luciferase family)